MTAKNTTFRRALAAILIALFTQACGQEPAPMGPDPEPEPNLEQVNSYLTTVGSWPTQPDSMSPTPTGETTVEETVVDSVATIDDQGVATWDYDVDYVCTTTPYSFQQTPEKIVMFSPDRDILWPGALIQGRSHADGSGSPGSLQALPISERAPIQVSIPSLPTGSNFRDVEVVTLANVESAVGSIIGEAVAEDLFSPASDDFEVETYNSEAEFALKTRLSGRYLRFKASAGVDVNRSTSETTIAVRYIQKMYEVVVTLPQTPREFFTDDFTQARLDQQIALDRIAEDNQPVYVANIVYGRMMMFTLTAQATASELKAIVNASYDAVIGGVSASLDARQEEVMSSSRIAISTYGGGLNGTQDMIRTGDWTQYFTQDVKLSDALPLSYTFRTLTGETAAVSEATNYEVETCRQLEDTPLTYVQDGAAQSIGSPVPTPFESHLADVTGDGLEDLILNHLSPSANEVAVLPGDASGVFGSPVLSSAPSAPADGWGSYQLLVGNVDGDANGQADLVWNNTGDQAAPVNRTFVALGQGDGSVAFGDAQERPTLNWPAGVRPYLADLDGDGAKDMVFSFLTNTSNRTDRSMSNGDGTFDMDFPVSAHAGGWGPYDMYVGNVDFDAADELVWNSRRSSSPNRTYAGQLDGATVVRSGAFDHPTNCCWTGYNRVLGDFDGDQRSDLMFLASGHIIHIKYNNGFGGWQTIPYLDLKDTGLGGVPPNGGWVGKAGDFNGDGVDDLIINRLDGENRVYVVPGKPNRGFAPAAYQPDHPASATWTGVRDVLVGDVTGEGRADAVWVVPGANTQVYVGLGRQN